MVFSLKSDSKVTKLTPNAGGKHIPASLEMGPSQVAKYDFDDISIPQGTRVYLTDLSIETPAEIAQACTLLLDRGIVAVPHIAARRLKDLNDLEDRMRRYSDAGVKDILVIGGSPEQLMGDFTSTMQVLESGFVDQFGYTDIGVAGHPEGSPDFSDEVADHALRLKKQFGERTDAQMRIVTQFGFDAPRFITWADGLAQNNIDLPVHLGVAGPAKITTLLKYAAMCGVGNSISFLKKRASALTQLATAQSPEDIVAPIENHFLNTEKTGIAAIHAFPFGGVKKTATWLHERGSWNDSQVIPMAANNA